MPEVCPHCGKVSGEVSPRFCSGCGARMDGSPAGYPAPPGKQKNPVVAGLSSSFLPGLGQVSNGETAKGFAIFLLVLAGLGFLVIPGLIVWLYAMYDAYSVAGKMNTGQLAFREARTLHLVLFIVFAVLVVIIALLVLLAMAMTSLSQSGLSGTSDLNRLFDTAF